MKSIISKETLNYAIITLSVNEVSVKVRIVSFVLYSCVSFINLFLLFTYSFKHFSLRSQYWGETDIYGKTNKTLATDKNDELSLTF